MDIYKEAKEYYDNKNYEKAKSLFVKAIELNNPYAMYYLANMYCDGNGVTQDYNKSIELYEKAISLNDSDSMNALAIMYEYGKGVKQDNQMAEKLYQQAINLNNMYAMHNLALLYEDEPTKKPKAKKLYKRSAKLNHIDSVVKLVKFYNNEDKVKKAVEYYIQIYKLDNSIIIDKKFKLLIDMYINLEEQFKLLQNENTELKYQPGGPGYLEAQKHFKDMLSKN